jgi:hypothetical protein
MLKLLGSLEYGKHISLYIPQCQSNNIKSPELSFHKIPNNPEIKKKIGIQLLKRKAVRDPGPRHRVCSLHFVDDKKCYNNTTYSNNIYHMHNQ